MMYRVRMTNQSLCDRLGGCIHVCPVGVWQWANVSGRMLPVPVNEDKCIGCMKCVRICPQKIIDVTSK